MFKVGENLPNIYRMSDPNELRLYSPGATLCFLTFVFFCPCNCARQTFTLTVGDLHRFSCTFYTLLPFLPRAQGLDGESDVPRQVSTGMDTGRGFPETPAQKESV